MPTTDKALVDRFTRHTVDASKKEVVVSTLEELFIWYRREANGALNRIGNKLRNINADPYPKNGNKPPHPGVVLIPGSGHFIEHEKPAEFNRVLDGMIAQFVDNSGKK
jgi:pimeloyl-ACP methyl ester carboxylesterase